MEDSCLTSSEGAFHNIFSTTVRKYFCPLKEVLVGSLRYVLRVREIKSELLAKRLHKYCGARLLK